MEQDVQPLHRGDYVRVTRGKHKGRTGQLVIEPIDRFGRPLRSVRVRYSDHEDIWHSVTVLERIDRYHGLPPTPPAILRGLLHPRHHERLGLLETDGKQ